ncbi:MAG: hypothetical protein JWP00_3367 [Chloroflexi bacterium]|nr:hypothetical protein [Chloroflexota bacterium]
MARIEDIFRILAEAGRRGLQEPYPAGLNRMYPLLERLGSPHAAFPAVIVTGSKGKGSTATFLANLLEHSPGTNTSPKIGLFTGPHLHTYRERIRLNGEMINPADFATLFDEIWEAARQAPDLGFISRFELLTILAFVYFARQGVDLAVMEVGMGGTYDAVNTARHSPLAVFTPVELEHAAIIGPTLADIVRHKSGIMRQGRLAVSSGQTAEVSTLLEAAAGLQAVSFHQAGEFWQYRPDSLRVALEAGNFSQRFEAAGPGGEIVELQTRLAGTFQVENALTALAAATLLHRAGFCGAPDPDALAYAALPGRFELAGQSVPVLLDAAHTPNAIRQLVQTLDGLKLRPAWILGFLRDKNIPEILRLLPLEGRPVFLTDVHSRRQADMQMVLDSLTQHPSTLQVTSSLGEALDQARQLVSQEPGGLVCLTGSMYLVGEARAYLGLLDPAIAAEARLIAELEA